MDVAVVYIGDQYSVDCPGYFPVEGTINQRDIQQGSHYFDMVQQPAENDTLFSLQWTVANDVSLDIYFICEDTFEVRIS